MRSPSLVTRLTALAAEATAFARRRRENREPRVRIRIAHGETRVLPEDAPERERILSLAADLASEYESSGHGQL